MRNPLSLSIADESSTCPLRFQTVTVEPDTGYKFYYGDGINQNFLVFSINKDDRNLMDVYVADFYVDRIKKSNDKAAFEKAVSSFFQESILSNENRQDLQKCATTNLRIEI